MQAKPGRLRSEWKRKGGDGSSRTLLQDFAPKEISQMGQCLEEDVGSWEAFLPGDITACLCDDGWIECSRKWLAQEGEAVFARVQSLKVRGKGSGVFPAAISLTKRQGQWGALCESRERGRRNKYTGASRLRAWGRWIRPGSAPWSWLRRTDG